MCTSACSLTHTDLSKMEIHTEVMVPPESFLGPSCLQGSSWLVMLTYDA